MSIYRLMSLRARYKPWQPRHARIILNDILSRDRQTPQSHEVHLAAAIEWLCRAQDVRDGLPDAGGVSAGWSFEDGWLPSYPETTGYIIETLLAAADILMRPELIDRAQRMIDWELSLQSPDGAFPGHFGEPGPHPVIFNQGQILHGVIAGYTQLGRQDCQEAMLRGAGAACHRRGAGAQHRLAGARRRHHHACPGRHLCVAGDRGCDGIQAGAAYGR